MPSLSFSEVLFVRSILEGKKTQTIRPLWRRAKVARNIDIKGVFIDNFDEKTGLGKAHMDAVADIEFEDFPTEPRLKVGDEVKFYFKQRTLPKDAWFCTKCGEITQEHGLTPSGERVGCAAEGKYHWKPVPKHFATVTITLVEEIGLSKKESKFIPKFLLDLSGKLLEEFEENKKRLEFDDVFRSFDIFAQKDGFEGYDELTLWFDKHYDLSQARRFAVYRFKVKEPL